MKRKNINHYKIAAKKRRELSPYKIIWYKAQQWVTRLTIRKVIFLSGNRHPGDPEYITVDKIISGPFTSFRSAQHNLDCQVDLDDLNDTAPYLSAA